MYTVDGLFHELLSDALFKMARYLKPGPRFALTEVLVPGPAAP